VFRCSRYGEFTVTVWAYRSATIFSSPRRLGRGLFADDLLSVL
jgi:hypothetical protein